MKRRFFLTHVCSCDTMMLQYKGGKDMEKKVSLDSKFLYVVMTFLASMVSSNLIYWAVDATAQKIPHPAVVYPLFLIIMPALYILLCWVIVGLYLYKKFPTLYHRSEDKKLWIKKTVGLILPGELARYITSVLFYDRYFEKVTTSMYHLVYGSYMDESTVGVFDYIDDAVYSVIYFVLLGVFLAGTFFMCKKLWELGKKDYENLYGAVKRD